MRRRLTCGKDALALMKTTRPELMILDVMMPEMTGLQVLEKVRQMPGGQDVPVVMYTADSAPETRQEALRLRANDFLIKGVWDWATLEKTICKYVPA